MIGSRFYIALAGLLFLSGCFSTPAVVGYKGRPVAAVNAGSMSCSTPYAFTQDCSAWSGASLRVKLKDLIVKVAASADGRTILVMTEKTLPTQYESELAADAVQEIASSKGAKLLKLEALAIGGNVPGYILTFDADVYTALKANALGS
jgi:hypothetical protein